MGVFVIVIKRSGNWEKGGFIGIEFLLERLIEYLICYFERLLISGGYSVDYNVV